MPAPRLLLPALVLWSSAAVLVVELVALRLLAPYLGLTLETNTLVIGIALAAIAYGSWAGGRAADRTPPQRLLMPLLLVSGAVVALTPFVVRASAGVAGGALLVPVAAVTILVPGAALSAVTPIVTKLRLESLERTGEVVGRLSGLSTLGAIAGTVVTGFVLISRVPVGVILVGLGASLVLLGLLVGPWSAVWRPAAAAALIVVGGGAGVASGVGGCDAETVYHCAEVLPDPDREGGRLLVLDGVRHSYVDLEDPTTLDFAYVRALAAAVETGYPDRAEDAPLAAHHVGGGGLTLPRWLAQVRPGSTSTVSEIDRGVVGVDRELLGLETSPALQVRVEDGRTALADLEPASLDLVVGDAFGGVSVPWHLTTREALREVRASLAPGGRYAANLIDHGPLAFARAEVATLRTVFEHVAVAADPAVLDRADGGNLVVLASDDALEVAAWEAALAERDTGWAVLQGDALDAWVGDAEVLTDDYAPVDQLLTPYG
ncbi:fused MFS/spermidine synthase [Nocardioides nanhaiensis]|uniref:Spermidine synthase n=1 Tax=Nocardioides nanhaiensis TaxID=1476871 RepID=A0ABP8WZE4_9ACTN